MDIDTSDAAAGDLMSLFDLSPGGFAWRAPRPHEIETRRAQLSDLLIFDILLSSGGLRQPDALWPPTDPTSLQRLLDAIEDSTYDTLKKDCLVYFLLKWHQDGREESFKEERCIPPQFAMLSDAYWHLDSGIRVERAVSLLCDVRLNRDYTSKIIQAISLSDISTPLLLQYLRTAKPMLTEPDDMDTYILALARSSLADAWQYQRTFPEKGETRTRLARKVLEWILSPKPRTEPLKQLISFPLSPFEQSLLHSFALDPPLSLPNTSVPVLQDLVCVRLLQSGHYAEAVELDRQFASTQRRTQAPQIIERRRKMIEDVIAVLPSIERLEIEEQSRAAGQRKPGGSAKSALNGASAAADLTMSWEEIPPPPPRALPASSSVPKSFVLGRSNHGHNQPKLAMGPAKGKPSIPATQSLPALTHAPGSANAVSSSSNGIVGAQTAKPTFPPQPSAASAKPGLFGPGLPTSKPLFTSAASSSHKPSPLFQSNASASRNHRYLPTEQSGAQKSEAVPVNPPYVEDEDAQMDAVADEAAATQSDEEDQHELKLPVKASEPSPVAEFSAPIFHTSSRPARAPHTAESVEPFLPGAFNARREAPAESASNPFVAHSPPTPPTRPRPAKTRRTVRTSVPGGFDEADADADADAATDAASGEEDAVPPLPEVSPVKRTTRRARVSRADSADEEEVASVRPRRSSRLSIASSSPEASPQKTSAGRTRGKTRASAGVSAANGGPPATRASTRKKR
ncbi:nuclear pore complex assembly-domain-containing protein [Gloeopeniophorella convolvens]|nr:nuclear pore complex assembly-domain-containing protein [Gloeopeniophorella convolvens]